MSRRSEREREKWVYLLFSPELFTVKDDWIIHGENVSEIDSETDRIKKNVDRTVYTKLRVSLSDRVSPYVINKSGNESDECTAWWDLEVKTKQNMGSRWGRNYDITGEIDRSVLPYPADDWLWGSKASLDSARLRAAAEISQLSISGVRLPYHLEWSSGREYWRRPGHWVERSPCDDRRTRPRRRPEGEGYGRSVCDTYRIIFANLDKFKRTMEFHIRKNQLSIDSGVPTV